MAKKTKDVLFKKPEKLTGGPGRTVKAHKTVCEGNMHDAKPSKGKTPKKKPMKKISGKLVSGHNAIHRG